MRELGLKAVIRKRRRYYCQKSLQHGYVYENTLNRDFQTSQPNQKWVTDISVFTLGKQQLYLSVIMDLFNNEIVAYQMSQSPDTQLVIKTLEKAVQKRKNVQGILLHSDQGIQYKSREYHNRLKQYGMTPSMSRKGNCLDNACIESFFSHLKTEGVFLFNIENLRQIQNLVHRYIHFYNFERMQRRLNNLTPVEYRRQHAV
jgi:putative transposase